MSGYLEGSPVVMSLVYIRFLLWSCHYSSFQSNECSL